MGWQELTKDVRPPVRKDVGTAGRRINLMTNYFEVTVKKPNINMVHYDVTITDASNKEIKLPKKRKLEIFQAMKTSYRRVFEKIPLAFDSEKNAYSVNTVRQVESGICSKYEVTLPGETGKSNSFFVKLEVVQRANLQDLLKALKYKVGQKQKPLPQNIFQMLDVMLGYFPSISFERVGRNSFFPMNGEFGDPYNIGGGKEGVTGFFTSLRPAAWKDGSLLLNVDVTNTAFYKEQPVLDFLQEALNFQERDFQKPLAPPSKKAILKELKNLKIQVTHSQIPRTYKVRNIGDLGADRQTFPLICPETEVTQQCTVQNYFLNRYQKRLRYPKLNCLVVGSLQRSNYIPMEFCKIVKGQKVQKKLNDRETATLIRSSAKPPHSRLNDLRNIVKTCNFSSDPMMKALEFSISDRPMNFDGRVLPAPAIRMNKDLYPKLGVWDVRDYTFFNGENLKTWAVLNYDPRGVDQQTMQRFLTLLQKMGRERGMGIEKPVQVKNLHSPQPERDLMEVSRTVKDLQLILVILPRFGDIYSRVKKTGDKTLEVITQCVKSINVSKCSPPTVGNILLKINAKIGGRNNVLSSTAQPFVFNNPVMIMGADVNHPSAGDTITPSVAAVVGSIDRYACKYAVEVRHQRHRTEIIQDLKDMTKNLLMTFYRATKRKPQRIVMYRDGVSESQFLEVLVYEMRAMREACKDLEKDYQPAITFLVVQKRHHTRLFCREQEGVGKSKNIPPGTTVDTTITHPSERDFFLCSHQGIQGTSRPTHYHVLWDDSDMTMDQLQALTYAMCHLYSRCTRSVSIPTPAYYAHLAAFRGKVHIQDLCFSDNLSVASGPGAEVPEQAVTQAVKVGIEHQIHSRLYYV